MNESISQNVYPEVLANDNDLVLYHTEEFSTPYNEKCHFGKAIKTCTQDLYSYKSEVLDRLLLAANHPLRNVNHKCGHSHQTSQHKLHRQFL